MIRQRLEKISRYQYDTIMIFSRTNPNFSASINPWKYELGMPVTWTLRQTYQVSDHQQVQLCMQIASIMVLAVHDKKHPNKTPSLSFLGVYIATD